jgi:hypothetical protein
VEDQTKSGHIQPILGQGINNWADYFTNHFASIPQIMRFKYLQRVNACISQLKDSESLNNHTPCKGVFTQVASAFHVATSRHKSEIAPRTTHKSSKLHFMTYCCGSTIISGKEGGDVEKILAENS